MPWDLSQFDRDRLEKGRRLLQESEEHRGSRDLQARPPAACRSPRPAQRCSPSPCHLQMFVESMDLTVQLHRIFLDDSGRQRQGLTSRENQEVGEEAGSVWHVCSCLLLVTVSPLFSN